jgi:hypothetical protein
MRNNFKGHKTFDFAGIIAITVFFTVNGDNEPYYAKVEFLGQHSSSVGVYAAQNIYDAPTVPRGQVKLG